MSLRPGPSSRGPDPGYVWVTEDELVIHDKAFVEAVRHRLLPRTAAGQRSPCKDHEPPRDAQRRSEQLAERFAEFGATGTRFLEGLLAGNRFGKNQAERVLSLAAAYGTLMAFHVVFGLFFGLSLVCASRGVLLYAKSLAAQRAEARQRIEVPQVVAEA